MNDARRLSLRIAPLREKMLLPRPQPDGRLKSQSLATDVYCGKGDAAIQLQAARAPSFWTPIYRLAAQSL
jgi:hypothetical protein